MKYALNMKATNNRISEACATNEPTHVMDVQTGISSLQVDNKQATPREM
jgi:hypothetical protein